MPRHRRTQRAHVDLAGLVERAQQQHILKHHSHIRPSKIYSRPTRTNMFPADKVRSRNVRSRNRSNTFIDVGRDAVWNTLVQPVSLLQWLPMRRTFRLRRNYRSRSRRSQRSGGGGGSGSGIAGVGGMKSDTPKIGSQSRMPAAEIEMPCCATESPTAEVQTVTQSRERCQQHQHAPEHDMQREQQPGNGNTFTPPLSTVILHQNPLFDAEGNTRSGLIATNIQKTRIERAKSKWNVRGVDTTPSKNRLAHSTEPTDVARKKSCGEKRVPAKKGSGSDESSAASVNASNQSHSTVDSGASSEKSKSDTDESNSFEESIDLTLHDELGLQLDNVAGSRNLLHRGATLLEAINGNTQNSGTAIKPKNLETMLAK